MDTVTRPPVSDDPLPPPGTTLFYRRCAEVDKAVELEKARRLAAYREAFDEAAARRGLPPEPWPA